MLCHTALYNSLAYIVKATINNVNLSTLTLYNVVPNVVTIYSRVLSFSQSRSSSSRYGAAGFAKTNATSYFGPAGGAAQYSQSWKIEK